MEVMKMIGRHGNILNLLGCCTQDGQFTLTNDRHEAFCTTDIKLRQSLILKQRKICFQFRPTAHKVIVLFQFSFSASPVS